MISFFINLFRFVKVIVKGIIRDSEFRFLFFFIIILLISSTLFYSTYEKWSYIDSLYFSVMTMSTVGYGDLVPSSDLTKIFTIVFTFLSIGTFVAFTAKIVNLLFTDRKSKKIIDLRKHKKEEKDNKIE